MRNTAKNEPFSYSCPISINRNAYGGSNDILLSSQRVLIAIHKKPTPLVNMPIHQNRQKLMNSISTCKMFGRAKREKKTLPHALGFHSGSLNTIFQPFKLLNFKYSLLLQ